MVLSTCFPVRHLYKNRHECALSQIGTRPDTTVDVARTKNNNKQMPCVTVDMLKLLDDPYIPLSARTHGEPLVSPKRVHLPGNSCSSN